MQILGKKCDRDWSPVNKIKISHHVLTEICGFFSFKCLCLLSFRLQGISKVVSKSHLSSVVVSHKVRNTKLTELGK